MTETAGVTLLFFARAISAFSCCSDRSKASSLTKVNLCTLPSILEYKIVLLLENFAWQHDRHIYAVAFMFDLKKIFKCFLNSAWLSN